NRWTLARSSPTSEREGRRARSQPAPGDEFGVQMPQELLEVPGQAVGLADSYRAVRAVTERLCAPLEPEDYQLQPTPDASPAKWHLAHTAWFFETFVLTAFVPSYRVFHPSYNYLFNSYYDAVGPRHPRPRRGLLSRPTVAETYEYRKHVDV